MSALEAGLLDVPDFAEPFDAWRVWRVIIRKDEYRLGSVVQPTLWTPDEPLAAECLRRSPVASWVLRKRGIVHVAPEARCECGIYGARLPLLDQYLRDPPANPVVVRVLGRVSLWGRVVECERGVRASQAYPLRLFVPIESPLPRRRRWEDLVAGLEVYGVPVEPLPARCSEAVDMLEQMQPAAAHGELN